MRKNKFLFLILFSSQVFAQDCGEIKEGEEKRLDRENLSLSQAKVQDQDGIGSCYANSASLLLQSVLPGNPEVSYLQLALNYGENEHAKVQRRDGKLRVINREKTADDKVKESLLFEGGFICDTINHAKSTGGVCARSEVALEQMMIADDAGIYRDDSWKQLDILKKVSQYYDGVLQNFQNKSLPEVKKEKKKGQVGFLASLFGSNQKNPDEETSKTRVEEERYNNFRNAMLNLIKSKEKEFENSACLKPNTDNVADVTKNLILKTEKMLNNSKTKKSDQLQLQLFNIYVGKRSKHTFNNNEIYVGIDPGFKNKMEMQYLKMLNSPTPPKSGVDAYKSLLAKSYDMDPKFLDKLMGQLSPDDIRKLETDYARYVKKEEVDCGNVKKLDYITDEAGLIKDAMNDDCLKLYVGLVKDFREMVVGLDKFNFRNVNTMNDFLENLLGLKYDDAMMKMLAPTCTANKKIKIPDNINCEHTNIDFPESAKSDPLLEAVFMGETKAKFKQEFSSAIKGNKPIGLSLCTVFFEKNKDSFYNKSGVCDPEKKHGFHAVTMMGYKCQAGKMKYLIQNSWGDWAAASDKFDSEYGKAWMSEEDLAKNVYRYDQIK